MRFSDSLPARATGAAHAAAGAASDAAHAAADAATGAAHAAANAATFAASLVKPRLRGVFHQYCFFISLIGGTGLVLASPTGRAQVASAVYAAALTGLFGSSALYHRVTWSPPARRWMRRLDHSMIFVLIAGTYTPFAVLIASGTQRLAVLAAVWGAALLGALLRLFWIDAPKWISVALAFAMGWLVIGSTPGLALQTGPAAVFLIVLGGVLYSIGALVYAFRRPNPAPAVFGYHEVFHAFVCAAAAAHFATIAFFVIPRG